MTLLHGFIFAFIQYFHGTILREKSCVKPRGEAGGGGGGWGMGCSRNIKTRYGHKGRVLSIEDRRRDSNLQFS